MGDNKKAIGPVLGFDEKFGQRLAGEDSYHDAGSGGSDFLDPRFGGMVNESTYRLRDVLPKMIEGSARDPEIAETLREAGIENPLAPFVLHVLDAPFKASFRDGKWHAEGTLRGLRYRLTANDKDGIIEKLIALARRLEAEAVHELTAQEKMVVVRRAQSGDVGGAIAEYLRLAIGEERANGYENPTAMLADPKLAAVFDDAALLVWFAARPAVEDSPEFHSFLSAYRGGRPLNLDLLDAAHAAWKAHAEKQVRADAVARFTKPEEPSAKEIAEGLEDMSDAEVTKQFWSVARAARGAR